MVPCFRRLDIILESVPLTIIYHLYFLRVSKVSIMLHHGSVGRVHNMILYERMMF